MKWNKKTDILALMVGHGTQLNGVWDCGCVYGDYTEADLMLKIVKVATKMLRKNGVRVLTDADKNNNRNMKSSVAWANSKKAKLYIDVHCDYKYGKIKGVHPIYYTESGKKMAVAIGKSVAKTMGMKYAGATKSTSLYVLKATDMPSMLLETGQIKSDLKYLKQYKKYGRALAKAICNYIGVPYASMTKAEKFNKKFEDILTYMNNHHFKYVASWKDCGRTWDEARKKKVSNCSMAVSYALQECGIFNKGWFFWCNCDSITCMGGLTKTKLNSLFDIDHPHKAPKKLKMKRGDIVGYGKPYNPHTMEFDKNSSKDNPMWCSWSNGDIGKKVPHVKKTYTNRPISTRLRLK